MSLKEFEEIVNKNEEYMIIKDSIPKQIDLSYYDEYAESLINTLLKSILTEEGYDFFNWWTYEANPRYQSKDKRLIIKRELYDINDYTKVVTKLYTIKQFYNYLVKNKIFN